MINGLDIYYSKNIGRGLKPISNNNKQSISSKGNGLKPISNNKQKANGLKPISTKGGSCKKYGKGLKILQ